jgi:AcrR family transcriptional regulator
MRPSEKGDARQRILKASISLFSKKGFAGVGVREIAAEADVNLAMISYYFNGKVGILKEIIEYFFKLYLPIYRDVDDVSLPPEECFRILIGRLVDFIRVNGDLFLMVYNELPLDVPELADLKARKMTEVMQTLNSLIRRFGLDPGDREIVSVVGSSLISGIITQFRLRPVFKRIFHIKPDERYYKRYVNTVCELYLNGLNGLKNKQKRNRSNS